MAAGEGDDPVLAATIAGGATIASLSGAPSDRDDETLLAPVDPSAYVRGATLATGGMGRIVAARDRRLGRPVAIKEVRAGIPELRRRFAREVRITARLQHPNIITVHEAGTWPDGEPFFAMKLVAGRSLDKVVAERTTLEARLALLPSVIAVADALAYAHRERVIHRDLKPANVLVGDFGETVVIDWGLAKDLSASDASEDGVGPYRERAAAGGETAFGAVIGTPAYMPPEQARGEHVDERADVYALGALAYHVLCGCAPVEGASVEDVLANVIAAPIATPRARDPRIPLELDTIIGKAMAHAPADRYPSAVELAADLKRFQTGQLVGAHHYTSWQLARRWIARRRTPLAVAAIALVVLAVGGVFSFEKTRRERDRANSSADTAAASVRTLFAEEARRELLDHHPLRALALLHEALLHGEASDDARYLLGVAMPFADTVVRRFGRDVNDVQFSADGQQVYTASRDGHVRTLDVASGALVRDLDTHETEHDLHLGPSDQLATLVERRADSSRPFTGVVNLATSVRFERVQRAKATVYDESGARAWRVNPLITVTGVDHAAVANLDWDASSLAARAHGSELLVVTEHELIRLRDAGTEVTEVSRTALTFPALTGAAISADLAHVVLASNGRIAFLDGSDAESTADSEASPRVAIRDDGTQVADLSRRGTVELFPWADSGSAVDVDVPTNAELVRADYSADGSRLAVLDGDSNIFVVDAKRAAIVTVLSGETGISVARISRDGSRVVAALRDGTAVLWDVSRARTALAAVDDLACARYAADGRLVTVGPNDVHIERTGAPIGTNGFRGACTLDPSGRHMVRSAAGTLEVIDLAKPADAAHAIASSESQDRVALAPGGHRVALHPYRGKAIDVFDDSARVATWSVPVELGPHDDFTFSPDGAHFAETSFETNQVFLFDSATGAPTTLAVPELRVLRWSADGSLLVIASADGTIALRDGRDLRARGTLRQSAGLFDIALSRDGSRMLTGGEDGVVRDWDVGAQTIVAERHVSRDPVERVALSPSTGLFATATTAHEAVLWSATTGERLLDLETPVDQIAVMAFSPDGARLLVLDNGGRARQWDTRLDPRTAEQIAPAIDVAVPWQVTDGRLVPRALAP